MTPFELALKFTLQAEGGYTSDPVPTNHGIQQDTYNAWRDAQGWPKRPVEQITNAEVDALYHWLYWVRARCSVLNLKLSVAHFDWSVNHGVIGAIKTLQRAAGVNPDGIFGPITNAAVNKADPLKLLDDYLTLRIEDYHQIVASNPSDSQFLAGWIARVHELRQYLKTL